MSGTGLGFGGAGPPPLFFEMQTPAVLNQAAPVQNQWYQLLPATANCRLYRVAINIEDVDETIAARVIVDGETFTGAIGATHSTIYFVYQYPNAITRVMQINYNSSATYSGYASPLFEGHSVAVDVRKTTAAGAGNLTGIALYGVLADV
jgi:hypothetical protein